MTDLAEECLKIINEGLFSIVDPGPLHEPIRSFSLRRNDKFALVLETKADFNAKSTAIEHPPGTIRVDVERAKLVNIDGKEAELSGLVSYSTNRSHKAGADGELTEYAEVHRASVTLRSADTAAYTIDWLENLPSRPFLWPDNIKTIVRETETRQIGMAGNGLTISSDSEQMSFSRTAVRLVISGVALYVCALGRERKSGGVNPGCIIYDGIPDDAFRKKIRIALSFALGLYLVDLGYSVYDREWRIVSALARSAYTLGRRAFEIGPQEPAPLSLQYSNELNPIRLTRAVEAFMACYDKLDLANLSWAYWHACAATPHIAPAHFGAAIEGLQRAYINANSDRISEVLMPRQDWERLKATLKPSIEQANIPDEIKEILVRKLATFNQVEQRALLKAVFASLGLQVSEEEDSAWRRRNKSAHGMPIPEGQEIDAIRDMKLLRGLFQRMLLRMTGAADQYIDYTSLNHPFRRLEEAPVANV